MLDGQDLNPQDTPTDVPVDAPADAEDSSTDASGESVLPAVAPADNQTAVGPLAEGVEWPQTHVAQPGESLASIVEAYYGDRADVMLPIVHNLNSNVIGSDPGSLNVGAVLELPQPE